jgi:hypothetical protein
VHVPSIPKAGGFTITSSPSLLLPSITSPSPYLELAIQKSPLNPPAAYLWLPASEILGTELQVRVGGSFVWPPPLRYAPHNQGIRRVVFVAGGVGVNPLMSIASFLAEQKMREGKLGFEVWFLYSTKDVGEMEEVLFLERLASVFQLLGDEGRFQLFLTGRKEGKGGSKENVLVAGKEIEVTRRRIAGVDLLDTLGPVEERGGTMCYICGVPGMTDEFVEKARKAEGMAKENILFEKWW